MGMEEGINQIVNIGAIDSALIPDYFWYVFLIICPGYILGLTIFYFKYQTVDSWFDKSSFDKTIISIFFGGLWIISVYIFITAFNFILGIKIVLNLEALSLIVSIIAMLLSGIMSYLALKRSVEDKALRRLEYESRKRVKDFVSPEFPLEDIMHEKVSKILMKYYKNFVWGGKKDLDIAVPDFHNPKIFIELKAIPTTKALILATEKIGALREKFPESQFVFVTDLHENILSEYRKNLMDKFDAFFDIYEIEEFEEYIKELSKD